MKNLDEIRALASQQPCGEGDADCGEPECVLARAVLELLPIVEAAIAQADAESAWQANPCPPAMDTPTKLASAEWKSEQAVWGRAQDAALATNEAVRAFRATQFQRDSNAAP